MIASEVILLSSGPTVMNASIVGPRTISATWLVLNCVTGTFLGLMPGDRLRLVSARASREQVKSLTNVHQIYVLRAAEEPTSRSENRKNTAFGAGAGTEFLCSGTAKSDKSPQYGPISRRI